MPPPTPASPARPHLPAYLDELTFPDEAPFLAIVASGRLICFRCGSRRVSLMPDWAAYRPQGGGG